jgi:hypothetical protein
MRGDVLTYYFVRSVRSVHTYVPIAGGDWLHVKVRVGRQTILPVSGKLSFHSTCELSCELRVFYSIPGIQGVPFLFCGRPLRAVCVVVRTYIIKYDK